LKSLEDARAPSEEKSAAERREVGERSENEGRPEGGRPPLFTRAVQARVKSGGDPLAFHPLSALLFLPVLKTAPKRGGLGPRAEEKKCGTAETVSLQAVLRTDADAHKTERKRRFLNENAVCLTAPLALLNVALNAALSTPAAFQVPVSPAPFTPRKTETVLRSFTYVLETRSLQTRPPRLLLVNSPRVFVYAKSSGPFAHLNGNKPAGRINQRNAPGTVPAGATLAVSGGRACSLHGSICHRHPEILLATLAHE
jgi:hypothetical protein